MRKSFVVFVFVLTVLAAAVLPHNARAQSEPFIGEVRLFAGKFAPRGWAFCNGQLLSISQNQTLFALIGATYGGDGKSTFALPDLRGRVPMHSGTGVGLKPRGLGEKGGGETVALAAGKAAAANAGSATDHTPFRTSEVFKVKPPAQITTSKQEKVIVSTPLAAGSNTTPYLCLNYIIALQGIFPSRK